MNILQSLKSLSAYPIPADTIRGIADGVGLGIDEMFGAELAKTRSYRLAQAGVYMFLSEAPNVSQGGVSFNFTDVERRYFRSKAETIYGELGVEDGGLSGIAYGYMGSDL